MNPKLLIGSLALRPAILSLGNLQPMIAHTLFPGTTKVYGQLLWCDSNPLYLFLKTAYGQVLQSYIYPLPMLTPTLIQNEKTTIKCRIARLDPVSLPLLQDLTPSVHDPVSFKYQARPR